MPKSYREVLERYDRARAFGETKTLPEYAAHLNDIYQTQDFSEGLRDGWWTRASTRADQMIQGSPVGDLFGALGGAVGGAFGNEEAGQRVGESLPRALLQSAPLYLAGPEAGIPATLLALGGTGLAFGSQTYADTGSAKAALLSGATAAALPAVGKFAGELGARAFGAPLYRGAITAEGAGAGLGAEGNNFRGLLDMTGAQRAAQFGASQVGQAAVLEASGYAQNRELNPDAPYSWLSPEFLIGQIPFTVHAAHTSFKAKGVTREQAQSLVKGVEKPRVKVEPFVPRPSSAEEQATTDSLIQKYSDIAFDDTIPVEEKEKALATQSVAITNPGVVQAVKDVRDASFVSPLDQPITITGKAEKQTNGNWRVRVDEHNGADRVGDIQGSTVFVNDTEPQIDPVTGKTTFKTKIGNVRPARGVIPPDPELGPELVPQEGGKRTFVPSPQDQTNVPGLVGEGDVFEGVQKKFEETLTPTEISIAREMKVPERVLEDVTTHQELKPIVEGFETGKIQEETSRKNVTLTPKSEEEWEGVTDFETAAELTKAELAKGATPTQAAETARLLTQTLEVERAVKVLEELTEQAQTLEKVKSENYKGEEQNQYDPVLDDKGFPASGFESRADALAWEDDYRTLHPEDKRQFAILNRGLRALTAEQKARKAQGEEIPRSEREERGYWLGTLINKGPSLDAPQGDGGVNLHDKVAGAATNQNVAGADQMGRQRDEGITSTLPKVAVENMLDTMEAIEETPISFERRLKEVGLTREEWASVKDDLTQDTFDPENELHVKVSKLFQKNTRKPSLVTLGSTVPSDPEVVARMGLARGAHGLVDWIEGLKIPTVSDQVQGYRNFPEILSRVSVVHEGPDWTPIATFYDGDTHTINLDSLPTKATEREAARVVAHELNHNFTLEGLKGTDPVSRQFQKEAGDILEALRKGDLPKKVKDLLSKALKEKHYEQYLTGKIKDIDAFWKKTLGPELHKQYSGILYGLMNTSEMAAQMHSNHSFISFMEGTRVPGEKGTNGLNWFARIWSKLMGKGVENDGMVTAFEAMTKSFDDYLTGGLLRKTYNGKDYIRDMLVRKVGVRPEALASRMNTVDRTFTKGDLYSSIYGFEREGQAGTLPVTMTWGDVDQPLCTALVSGETRDVFRGTMSLLPEQVPVHQELFYRMQQDVELARNLYAEVKAGRIQATIPEGAEARLKLASVKLNSMKRALAKQGLAIERQSDLKNFTWEGLRSRTGTEKIQDHRLPFPASEPPEMELAQGLMGLTALRSGQTIKNLNAETVGEVRTRTDEEALEGKARLTFAEKNFMQTQHLASLHPEVQSVVDTVFDKQAAMKERANLLNEARFTNPETGHKDDKLVDVLNRVIEQPKRREAYTDLMSLIQEKAKVKGTSDGPLWSPTDADVKPIFARLGPLEREDVLTQVRQDTLQHKYFVNTQFREFAGEMNHLDTSKVVAALDGMLPEQAKIATGKLYEALGMMRDPAQAEVGQELLRQASTQMTGPTFVAALKHANSRIVATQKTLDVMKQFYEFVSEKRYDRIQMRMVDEKGVPANIPARNEAEARQRRVEYEKKGFKFLRISDMATADTPAAGIKPEILSAMQDMDASAATDLEAALAGHPDPAARAALLERIMPLTQRADQVESSIKAFSPLPMPRKLVAGREFIDMLSNREEFYKRSNNWMNHRLTRAAADLDMLHPQIAGNRVMKKLMEDHVQHFLTPDNPIATKINEMVFYQRMGLNFGNMMLESGQSLTTGMQALIAETGSVADALGLTAAATKESLKWTFSGDGSSPEMKWLKRAAELRGDKAPVLFNDMQDSATDTTYSISAKLGKPVHKATGALKGLVHKFGGAFQIHNNNVGMIAGFKIALDQMGPGPKSIAQFEEAYTFARNLKNKGTFTGGKAQRQIGMYGMLGPKGVAVPQLMGSLQTYVVGWFSQMSKDFKVGFGGKGGATEQQRAGSRKAFLYGLTAQAVLAGGLGLPGVGQGIALLNQATGIDLKGWLRQNLASLFDEDQDSGGWMTNLALRGAGQAFSPVDPSSRSAISVPFVGLDPYKGFSVASLAGAPGTSVQDFVIGTLAAARGDLVGFQKLLPTVAKGPVAMLQGGGDVRDSRGALLQTLTPAERWLTALGLPSSRIALARDTADTLKRNEAAAQKEKESLVDKLAVLVRKGDILSVQRQMLELRKANPALDLRGLAKSIATRVDAQVRPYSERHVVNPAVDLAGLREAGTPSTEMAGRQIRAGVEQSLGFTPRVAYRGDQEAQNLDLLLNSDPYMTRSQAMMNVRGNRPVRRPYTPVWQ